jgi:hypothetical protein
MQVRTDSAADSRCYWAAICLISFALMNQCVSVQPRLVARPVRLASQPNCPGDVAPASAGHAWANCAWARRSERCKHPWPMGLGRLWPIASRGLGIELSLSGLHAFLSLATSCLEEMDPSRLKKSR